MINTFVSQRRFGSLQGQTMNHNSAEAVRVLRDEAFRSGFELFGVAPAKVPETFDKFQAWIEAGCHAGMNYLARNMSARSRPGAVLEGVRSLVMLGVSYDRVFDGSDFPLSGVARYARGRDYHLWIRDRLEKLAGVHGKLFPNGKCRGTVDTAPILERQFAVDAGLGRVGKNTMLIQPELGSRFFLASLLSTEELDWKPSAFPNDPCSNCRRCLDACPTGAIVEPYVLDARRCLNYWTIEHQGEIPDEIAAMIGTRFFGCDTCQDVCPWNRGVDGVKPVGKNEIDPKSLDAETFFEIIKGTPLERKFRRSPQPSTIGSDESPAG